MSLRKLKSVAHQCRSGKATCALRHKFGPQECNLISLRWIKANEIEPRRMRGRVLIENGQLGDRAVSVGRNDSNPRNMIASLQPVVIAFMDQIAMLFMQRDGTLQNLAIGLAFPGEIELHTHVPEHGCARAEMHIEPPPGNVAFLWSHMIAQYAKWQKVCRAAHDRMARTGVVIVARPHTPCSLNHIVISPRASA